MDEHDRMLLRKYMLVGLVLLGAVITWTALVVTFAFNGETPAVLLLSTMTLALAGVARVQLSPGWLRAGYEYVFGPPDSPYISDLRDQETEATLDA